MRFCTFFYWLECKELKAWESGLSVSEVASVATYNMSSIFINRCCSGLPHLIKHDSIDEGEEEYQDRSHGRKVVAPNLLHYSVHPMVGGWCNFSCMDA